MSWLGLGVSELLVAAGTVSAHPLSGWAFIPSHPVPQPAPPLSLSILPLHTRLAAKCPLQPKAPFPKASNYLSFLSIPL